MRGFTRFVAIDWSGAKVVGREAIAIAWAAADGGPPMLLRPAQPWTRAAVLDWLRVVAASGEPWLVGMDFSFAPPFLDRGAYLPGSAAPTDAPGFWSYVEARADDADLGAVSFVTHAHPEHFYTGAASGAKAAFQRWRVCEAAFNASGGGKAASLFDCIGAAQVGKASLAGMRLLHRLRGALPAWPIDPLPAHGPVLVEIYCRAFLRLAGQRGVKLRDGTALDAALAGLGSATPRLAGRLSDHQSDVLVAAAGLRAIAGQPHWWEPPALTRQVAATEGWTFGVA